MKVIACGCSWTLGTYSRFNDPLSDSDVWTNFTNQSYATLLSSDTEIWAQNGVSNYAIACQVTDAIEAQPDLIVFNTTVTSRYDIARPHSEQGETWCAYDIPWLRNPEKRLGFINEHRTGEWRTPSRTDFFDPDQNPHGKILSRGMTTIKNLRDYGDVLASDYANYQPGFSPTDAQRYLELQTEYSDWGIKQHTDSMIVNSVVRDLEVSDIPWICVDITGIAPEHDRRYHIDIYKILNDHPQPGDPAHWSQSGHDYIGQELCDRYL